MKRVTILAGALALGFVGHAAAGPAATSRLAASGDALDILRGGKYHPVPPAEGFEYPECYCTDTQGGRVEIGETACLTINSEPYFAKCGMSLNNPTWRRLHEGCPVS